MSAWWRANRWFVIALAVIVPAAVVVSMVPRWFPFVDRQPVPEDVARGDTVRYAGSDIQLTQLTVLDGDEWGAPPGADVVLASFSIDVVERVSSRCLIEVVSTENGFERRWQDQAYSSDYDVPDRFETYCSLSEAGDYDLQLTFLVPADQVEEPFIEVTVDAALPRVLRLS
jgi:hypothetical protein